MHHLFISYSRKDREFVKHLTDALSEIGQSAWVDWKDIPPTAVFMQEIYAAIESADSFIFVISPDSCSSQVCLLELEHAATTHKRLIPIISRPASEATIPAVLASLNWISFDDPAKFDESVRTLTTAIEMDLEWVKAHTELLVQATAWDKSGRSRSATLRGAELAFAERTLVEAADGRQPTPTALQQEFVIRSRLNASRTQRMIIAAVSTALVITTILAAIAFLQFRSAEVSRKSAVAAAQEAKAVNDFLENDLLAEASPSHQAGLQTKPDPNLTIRTALDRAAGKIEARFAKQPIVEAAVSWTVGMAYHDLGLYPQAQRQLERAFDLRRRTLGEEHTDTLTVQSKLGEIDKDQGKFAQAEQLLTKLLQIDRRVRGEDHPDTLNVAGNLGDVYHSEGKLREAETLLTRVLEKQRHLRGDEDSGTLSVATALAQVYFDEGKQELAEALFAQNIEADRRVLGSDNPDTLVDMTGLAQVYSTEGKYSRAERLATDVLEAERRFEGAGHPHTLIAMANLASIYHEEGKFPQAIALLRNALESGHRLQGEDHPDTLSTMSDLAANYSSEGRYAEAVALDLKVLETRRRILGEEHPDTLLSMNNLALDYEHEGKAEQAEALEFKVLELRTRVLGDEHPLTLASMSSLGAVYATEGKYAQAETLHTRALKIERRIQGNDHPDTLLTMLLLGEVQIFQRKYSEAESILREAVRRYQGIRFSGWQRYNGLRLLGESLAGQKRYFEAESLLLSGYQGLLKSKETIGADDIDVLEDARTAIIQLYTDWGKPQKAAAWRMATSGCPVKGAPTGEAPLH